MNIYNKPIIGFAEGLDVKITNTFDKRIRPNYDQIINKKLVKAKTKVNFIWPADYNYGSVD